MGWRGGRQLVWWCQDNGAWMMGVGWTDGGGKMEDKGGREGSCYPFNVFSCIGGD